jgi:cell division protein FtsN
MNYEFSIPKKRLVGMGTCLLATQALFYAAGVGTGLLIHPEMNAAAKPIAQAQQPSQPASKPASSPPPPAATAAAAAAPITRPDDDTRTLSVQVGSFQDEGHATKLAAVLRRAGFGPVSLGKVDRAAQTWHVVRMGPYRSWDEAERISADLDRSYDLRTSIRVIESLN